MTHSQKLSSIFKDKSKFEQEIAMCGFRLNQGLKEDFKYLQESGGIEKSLLKKYNFICSEEHFSKSVHLLLREIESEINKKVNIVAEVNLKSEFLFSSIQKLSELVEKIEQLSEQYPKINLDKLQDKSKLFLKNLNLDITKPSNIATSDDIIDELVVLGKKMSDVQVTKNILNELSDVESSDIYMNCLFRASTETTNTISRIILENQHLLSANFNFSGGVPYLISKEHPPIIETKFDILKNKLIENGFFELEKVKILSDESRQKLISLISENKMPYGIAMFEFLGFLEYLDSEHGTKYKADHILSKLYNNEAKDGTTAKHLRRSLVKPLPRYKACEYKEKVIIDYQKIK
jgi:hypothetical protein